MQAVPATQTSYLENWENYWVLWESVKPWKGWQKNKNIYTQTKKTLVRDFLSNHLKEHGAVHVKREA